MTPNPFSHAEKGRQKTLSPQAFLPQLRDTALSHDNIAAASPGGTSTTCARSLSRQSERGDCAHLSQP